MGEKSRRWEAQLANDGLESIYLAHRAGLFAMALAITRSRPDAEDAVHDAFARLQAGDRTGPVSTAFLFACVRNAAIDRVRKRANGEVLVMTLHPCIEHADVLSDRDRDALIADAVDSLPEEHRNTVILRLLTGLTFREIGEIENRPLATIASRYKNALDKLRLMLKDRL